MSKTARTERSSHTEVPLISVISPATQRPNVFTRTNGVPTEPHTGDINYVVTLSSRRGNIFGFMDEHESFLKYRSGSSNGRPLHSVISVAFVRYDLFKLVVPLPNRSYESNLKIFRDKLLWTRIVRKSKMYRFIRVTD